MKPTKHLLFLAVLFAVSSVEIVCAKNTDKTLVCGDIKDIATHRRIEGATIEVLRMDSTLIAKSVTRPENNLPNIDGVPMNGWVMIKERIRDERVLLKVSHPEYATKYSEFKLIGSRKWIFNFGSILLFRDNFQLDEVTVSATKVRMVMGKDTITYNASEFQLAQGSMLDGLIRQLPGVMLDGDRITVNGRFVSSLLVNGEDFFKGDPSVALQNLPAYMVNKVKVYERTPDHAYITGVDSLKEYPTVMDVRLKREYATGWVANAEAAYGTDNRYLGRVFGLRFSDVSRLALFGNFNNTNDTRSPGSSGNWNPEWQASGLTNMQYGGAELLLKDLDEEWKLTSNVKLIHEDIDNLSIGTGSYFLGADNVYMRNRNSNRTDRLKVISNNNFKLRKSTWYATVSPSVQYSDGSNRIEQLAASFSTNIVDSYRGATIDTLFAGIGSKQLEESLINRVANTGEGWNKSISATLNANAVIDIPHTPDFVDINLSGSFDKANGENYSHIDLRHGKNTTGSDMFQNRYNPSSSLNYKYEASAMYNYSNAKQNPLRVIALYSYSKHYSSGNYKQYRLDRFSEWSGDTYPLGALPSTTDSLQQSLDYQNSYRSIATSDIHKVDIKVIKHFRLLGKQMNISLQPVLRVQTDKLDYTRGEVDTTTMRSTIVLEPYVRLGFDDFGLSYHMSYSEPSLVRMLDIVDDNNPLVVRYGNPNLKRTLRHSVNLNRSWWKREISRDIRLTARYNFIENAVAEAMVYDPQTGIRTYRPENINGNWDASAAFHFTQALDKEQRFFLTTKTDASFANSVDYLSLADAVESTRSEVRNLVLSENLALNYKWKNYSIGLRADVRYTNATSPRTDFTTINVADFNYGVNAQLNLPWNFSLSTDLTMYSRRGYEDRTMNSNDLVWNARLTNASLLHGNLIFTLDGFDILGQLSTVRRTLNAQGRTETWYNTVPRYAMLHIVYRLNIEPKKRK